MDIVKLLHLRGLWRKIVLFLVNKVYAGTSSKHFEVKRRLLNSTVGFEIGEGTRIVAPIECTGTLKIGKACWIGKNLKVNGNGSVVIGDNCDIGPEVTFQTGGHEIGDASRRAGGGHSSPKSRQRRMDWRSVNDYRDYLYWRFMRSCRMRLCGA